MIEGAPTGAGLASPAADYGETVETGSPVRAAAVETPRPASQGRGVSPFGLVVASTRRVRPHGLDRAHRPAQDCTVAGALGAAADALAKKARVGLGFGSGL